ncbi:MAG: Tol-Pal system beta propeller repeat protein TolB [Deltaproteobacteria bacterium]|nr:MAG: Tol-Pal system beta propeller repeat protein TolB [Deltaproteobacteria bacterium]
MNCRRSRKFRTYLLYLSVSLLVILQATPAASRLYIDIDSPMQKKLKIAIPRFRTEGGTAADQLIGRELAEILSNALDFSGLFQILNPAVFLQDPEQMGVELQEINFSEWRFLNVDLLVRGSYKIQGDLMVLTVRLYDVIQQKRLLRKTYGDRIANARQTILDFADEIMLELTGQRGIFQTKIAFVGDTSGQKEIFLADFDGSNIVQLTHNRNISLSPAWSADGKKISYVGYQKNSPDLYIVDLITRAVQRLRMGSLNIAPAWHPKEAKLAATLSRETSRTRTDLYLLDVQGQIVRQLTNSWSIDVSPSWSPDGRKLAYVSNRAGKPQIYVLDLDTGRSTRLTFEGDYNTSPAWSPRGDRIAYAGLHNGQFDIYTIRPDGRELLQLTGGAGNNEDPCWSADGRLILFQSDRQGSNNLWLMLANGADQRQLRLNLRGSQTEPSWSPRLTWTPP